MRRRRRRRRRRTTTTTTTTIKKKKKKIWRRRTRTRTCRGRSYSNEEDRRTRAVGTEDETTRAENKNKKWQETIMIHFPALLLLLIIIIREVRKEDWKYDHSTSDNSFTPPVSCFLPRQTKSLKLTLLGMKEGITSEQHKEEGMAGSNPKSRQTEIRKPDELKAKLLLIMLVHSQSNWMWGNLDCKARRRRNLPAFFKTERS